MGKGKLDLYAIGQGGVNVVKSPIVLDRDEALLLQNVVFPTSSGEGGIQKRGGLGKHNSAALNAGANILSINDIPLPNPFNTTSLPRTYIYAADDGIFQRSTDGTTWEELLDPPINVGVFSQDGKPVYGPPTIQPIQGKLFFISGDSSIDDWWVWDNVSAQMVLVVPPAAGTGQAFSAGATAFHGGNFYFATQDPPNGRVYKFDLQTGQLTMIGGGAIGSSYTVFSICSYLNQLFIGASDNVGGAGAVASGIYRCDPDTATAWTLDTSAIVGVPTSMVNFLGNLYIVTGSRKAADSMNIYKRTPSGVYSTVLTDASPWNIQSGGPLFVFDDKIFAYVGGTIYRSTDGAVWVADLDYFATFGGTARPGFPIEYQGAMYWPFEDTADTGEGRILKRTTGAVWSTVLGPNAVRGAITVFEVP